MVEYCRRVHTSLILSGFLFCARFGKCPYTTRMSYVPQRIVSLQPSVTVTIDRLGLLDHVVACTKYCLDVCPALREQSKIIVADSWTAQSEQILAANPDMV